MLYFIVNPQARSGKGIKVWQELKVILHQRKQSYRTYFTKYQGHATAIARTITGEQPDPTIIIVGGDGTVNEVINGITSLSGVRIGYIPVGSGNDFARGLSLPFDPAKALCSILDSTETRAINLGATVYLDHTGPRTQRKLPMATDESPHRFAVSAGIGYDADVCHHCYNSAAKNRLNKIGLGRLCYLLSAVTRLFLCKPCTMTLTLDDGTPITFLNTIFGAALNLPYEGGGCRFCPDADPDDDCLDIIIAANISRLRAITILPQVLWGGHIGKDGVYLFRAKKAVFKASRALPIHTDGEPVAQTQKLEVSVEPEKIHIMI